MTIKKYYTLQFFFQHVFSNAYNNLKSYISHIINKKASSSFPKLAFSNNQYIFIPNTISAVCCAMCGASGGWPSL